jgi:hypothetical protein
MYFLTFSVTLLGDKLNVITVTGCCVVFSGVLLYKIVFQLEKEAKTEETLKEHNMEYEVVGKLINEITVADVHYATKQMKMLMKVKSEL